MLTLINEERSQIAAQRGGRVVNGEDGVSHPHVPDSQSSLRPLAKARNMT